MLAFQWGCYLQVRLLFLCGGGGVSDGRSGAGGGDINAPKMEAKM